MARQKKAAKAEVVKTESKPLAVVEHEWPDTRIKLLRDTIAKDASPEEFELAMQVVKRTGLDPFARQIYFISRVNNVQNEHGEWVKKRVMTWQFSIDGFRLISQRTGKYQGMVGPFWCGKDGAWSDVWLGDGAPHAAKVGILCRDFTEPLWGVAKFSSYVVTDRNGAPNAMWKKMPEVMLAKCAEALARRAAFPQELSGLYTEDEMAQAKHGEPIVMPEATNHRAEQLAKDVTPQKAETVADAVSEDDKERERIEKEAADAKAREAKIITTIEKWKKSDDGKEAMSLCLRLGYQSKSAMFEKFEQCNSDFENFFSVLRDEWAKKQGTAQ